MATISFGGQSFEMELDDPQNGMIPLLGRGQTVFRARLLNAAREAVQVSALGNPRWHGKLWVQGISLATFLALAGAAPGTLSGVPAQGGSTTSYTNVILSVDEGQDVRAYIGANAFNILVTLEQVIPS